MSIKLRRGPHVVDLPDIAAVRDALEHGQLEETDEIFVAKRGEWRPVGEVMPSVSSPAPPPARGGPVAPVAHRPSDPHDERPVEFRVPRGPAQASGFGPARVMREGATAAGVGGTAEESGHRGHRLVLVLGTCTVFLGGALGVTVWLLLSRSAPPAASTKLCVAPSRVGKAAASSSEAVSGSGGPALPLGLDGAELRARLSSPGSVVPDLARVEEALKATDWQRHELGDGSVSWSSAGGRASIVADPASSDACGYMILGEPPNKIMLAYHPLSRAKKIGPNWSTEMLCCLEIMLGAVLPGAHAAQDLLDLLKPWGQDIVRILRSGGGQFTTRVATFTLSTGAGAFSPNTTIGSFDTVMVFLEATSSERPPSATPRAQVAATTAGSASSPRATNVDACRFPDCDRLLAGVPDSYSGHDANVDGNYDLGVCVSARRLRTTDNDLLRGAAYYSLGRAWWYKGCALKAREAFNRSLCVRPTHRNPTVIETVRNGCLEVGLGPCTGCGSSGPDPTSP